MHTMDDYCAVECRTKRTPIGSPGGHCCAAHYEQDSVFVGLTIFLLVVLCKGVKTGCHVMRVLLPCCVKAAIARMVGAAPIAGIRST